MAHFYSRISGSAKTEATRCGTKSSGIRAVATGWDIGGEVVVRYNPTLQTDVVYLYTTRGSNRPTPSLVAAFALDADGNRYCVDTRYPELFV